MLSDFPIGHADQLKDRRDKEGLVFLHSYHFAHSIVSSFSDNSHVEESHLLEQSEYVHRL
jgi:hypothetical protein